MPHKHKRRQADTNAYDLPPNLIAKPLPVRDATSKPKKGGKNKPKPKDAKSTNRPPKSQASVAARQKSAHDDDTPRAFRRLMQLQQAQGNKKRKRDAEADDENSDSDSSSDGGNRKNDRNSLQKNNKKKPSTTPSDTKPTSTAAEQDKAAIPKILPGEKLSDFAARVNREMPISEMNRSNKPALSDLPNIREQRQTKHEKHLRRLQRQWREDDVKIREKEAAEREEREAEMEEQLELWKEWDAEGGQRKAKKKATAARKKSKGGDGGGYDDGPDPWAKLKKKRANPFEQAQEPPQLKKPKEVFKVRGGAKVDVANVPAAVGSLRRREELANERRNIVEEYRRLMAAKRQ